MPVAPINNLKYFIIIVFKRNDTGNFRRSTIRESLIFRGEKSDKGEISGPGPERAAGAVHIRLSYPSR
jgi:hypothetical protein